MKQKLITLKHAAGPLLEYSGKLYGGRVPQVCGGLGEYFRDVYDHLIRLNQSIDAARDTVSTAIQVNLALVTVGESEITKRLAAYAALVAVPTMIAGVYGMNFEHMPELKWTYGYPLAIAVMVGARRLPVLPLPQGRLAVDRPRSRALRGRRPRHRDAAVLARARSGPARASCVTSVCTFL